MSGKRQSLKSSESVAPNKSAKKSRGSDIRSAFLGTAEQVRKSLEVLHGGKRLLLKASAIYGKKGIPRGEEPLQSLPRHRQQGGERPEGPA